MAASTTTCPPRAASLREVEEQLKAMARHLKRVIAERAASVHPDLQPTSFLVLGWIAEHGPVRGSAVVEQFHVDKGAVSRQLQHLVELGLVERTQDPADGRAQLVSASAEARRRLDQAEESRRRLWNDRLADWTPEELAEFARQLRRFNDATADG